MRILMTPSPHRLWSSAELGCVLGSCCTLDGDEASTLALEVLRPHDSRRLVKVGRSAGATSSPSPFPTDVVLQRELAGSRMALISGLANWRTYRRQTGGSGKSHQDTDATNLE